MEEGTLFLHFLPKHFAQAVIRSRVDGVPFGLLMFLCLVSVRWYISVRFSFPAAEEASQTFPILER